MAALGLHCRALAFSSWGKQGLLSRCGVWASHWLLFSCTMGSRHAGSVVLVHGLSCHIWSLPGPGIEPVSPALAGRCRGHRTLHLNHWTTREVPRKYNFMVVFFSFLWRSHFSLNVKFYTVFFKFCLLGIYLIESPSI